MQGLVTAELYVYTMSYKCLRLKHSQQQLHTRSVHGTMSLIFLYGGIPSPSLSGARLGVGVDVAGWMGVAGMGV